MKNRRIYGDLIINPVVEYDKRYKDNIIEQNARHIGLYLGKEDVLDNIYNIISDESLISGKESIIAENIIEAVRYDDSTWGDIYDTIDYNSIQTMIDELIYSNMNIGQIPWDLDNAVRDYIKNNGISYDTIRAIIDSECELSPDNIMIYDDKLRYYSDTFDKNNPFNTIKNRIIIPDDISDSLYLSIYSGFRDILNDYKYENNLVEYILKIQGNIYEKIRGGAIVPVVFNEVYKDIINKFGGYCEK